MDKDKLLYPLALSMIPGIGSITARKILTHVSDHEAIFRDKKLLVGKIPGLGEWHIRQITSSDVIERAEREIHYMIKNEIRALYFEDQDYPRRLCQCNDAPVVLFVKGDVDLNEQKILSVVGTRNPTSYGTEICRKIISGLSAENQKIVIVSGLAYGIDICAHKSALRYNQPTVAVLGHGLDYLYPQSHRSVARKIIQQGALITDFSHDEEPERNNFIKRNRIIAGISDATIVVESAKKGGALLTAQMANSYDRDVFTIPGRITDPMSAGCNELIKTHRAAMIESWEDIEYLLGWEKQERELNIQKTLFVDLLEEEKNILDIISEMGEVPVDILCVKTGLPVNKISVLLLNLEFAGHVTCLPGNIYKIFR